MEIGPLTRSLARETGAVVVEQAVAVGKRRLVEQWRGQDRADAPVDQHDVLA
jgi:hypothetical protein